MPPWLDSGRLRGAALDLRGADIPACLKSPDAFSFPGGHALHAFAFAPLLWSLAILAALARVVLGLHVPNDVLMGALIGIVTSGLVLLAA
jgi:undecaprenyl-diphosphatase